MTDDDQTLPTPTEGEPETAAEGSEVVEPDPTTSSERPRPRRWPWVLAVAACVVLVGGLLWSATREDEADVSIGDNPPAGTGAGPTHADPNMGTLPPPTRSRPALERPDIAELGNYPASACRGVQFTATTPPESVEPAQVAPVPTDPRVPQQVQADLVGLFRGETATRAVLVVAGWPDIEAAAEGDIGDGAASPEDGAATINGPFAGTQSWIAPYGDGWLAYLRVPLAPDVTCPATLVGVGLDGSDFRQFVDGLTLVE